jgi:hypothetical protein
MQTQTEPVAPGTFESRNRGITVSGAMIGLRILILVLVLAALLVAAVPVLILLDLVGGGTGAGLCPDGLEACPLRFTSGPTLAVYLTISLMVVVALIRVASRLLRRLDRQRVSEPR